jgi:hypothetical protein
MEKYVRLRQFTGGNITQCKHFACRLTKATDTNSEYRILSATAKMVMQQHLSVTFIRTMPVSLIINISENIRNVATNISNSVILNFTKICEAYL